MELQDRKSFMALKLLTILVSSLFLLSGCKKNAQIEFVDVRNAANGIEELKSLSLSNLNLSNTQYNIPAEGIGTVSVIETDRFLDREEEFWNLFIGSDFEKKNVINDPRYTPPGPIYRDASKNIYATVGVNGFFCYEQEVFDNEIKNSEPKWSCDIIGTDEIVDPNGCNIKELLNKIMPLLDQTKHFDRMDWEPFRVRQIEDNGKYYYVFELRKTLDQIPISVVYGHYTDPGQERVSATHLNVMCDPEGNIVQFVNQSLLEKTSFEQYDSIVSLKSALVEAGKHLTDNKRYDVKYAELVYRIYQTNIVENDVWPRVEYELKPFWAFYISLEYGKEIYIMVDCKTGEVEFVNNAYGWTE